MALAFPCGDVADRPAGEAVLLPPPKQKQPFGSRPVEWVGGDAAYPCDNERPCVCGWPRGVEAGDTNGWRESARGVTPAEDAGAFGDDAAW